MKIVFLETSTIGKASIKVIEELGELVCYPTTSAQEAPERVKDAEVIIVNKLKITEELLATALKLKLICVAATGVNNIDLEAAAKRGIPVKNVAGYSTDSVAQITFSMILALLSKVSAYDKYIKDGSYSRSGLFTDVREPYTELAGKTIGIIGMGAIGTKVAAVASAMGMKVIYYSTTGTSHCTQYPSVSLNELLCSADIISVHCPLNERTKGLLAEKELAQMKPSAILINVARGGIVNEAALSEAVGSGKIAGAGVDVFTTEPIPNDNPLMHCARPERLILTPHIAWASKEAIDRLVEGVAANIRESMK